MQNNPMDQQPSSRLRFAALAATVIALLAISVPFVWQHDVLVELWLHQRLKSALFVVPALATIATLFFGLRARRSRDGASAQATLARARAAYRAGGDSAGEALCLMTAADWEAAPFSTPLAWNLALSDSSSQGSNVFQQIESDEFGGGRESSYDEAEALFAQGGARRGAAAIQLRRGYGAMLRDDWPAAGACAIRARDDFASSGDRRGEHLASTHLLMCQLSGAGVAGVDVAAIEISAQRERGDADVGVGQIAGAANGLQDSRGRCRPRLRRGHDTRGVGQLVGVARLIRDAA